MEQYTSKAARAQRAAPYHREIRAAINDARRDPYDTDKKRTAKFYVEMAFAQHIITERERAYYLDLIAYI